MNHIDASMVARKRATYLINEEMAGVESIYGCQLGVPTWCQLNGMERKSLYQSRNHGMSLRILLTIAEHFDCSVDYLLGRTNKKEVNK